VLVVLVLMDYLLKILMALILFFIQ